MSLENYLLSSSGFTITKTASPAMPLMPSMPSAPAPPVAASKPAHASTALAELSMWTTWKNSGYNKKNLKPLKNSLKSAVKSNVNIYKAANVPTDLIEMEAKRLTIEALKSYDPTKGTAVNSHVNNELKRLYRFVVEHQNIGRVQENRAGNNIKVFNESRSALFEELGRDPTAQEVASHIGIRRGKQITVSQVEMMMKESRKDRNVSDENFSFTPTDTRILIKLLPEVLTPIENQVFERYYGVNGSPKMKPGQISKALKLSPARVSRVLNKISDKANEYM